VTEFQRTSIRRSVEAWQRAAPVLESVRRENIRNADTVKSIRAFRGLVLAKVKSHPPAPTSGLIEQQRLFRLVSAKT
jgi:hypothetical protein